MRIDALRLFILSAKHLNITQAARDFHISQSAASRQLRQLQSDLGVKLLRKNGRGIELTKVGKSVLSDVLPIFSQLEALQKKYLKSKESLAVACNHDLSTHFMPSVMTAFSERHPTAQLTLHVGNSAEIEDLLLATRVELAIITNLSASLSSILTLEPFAREPLV